MAGRFTDCLRPGQVTSQLWDTKYLCTEAQQGFGMDSSDHGELAGRSACSVRAINMWRRVVWVRVRTTGYSICPRWLVPRLL